MADLFYVDNNTREGKHCGSGGANVPALNSLLAPLGARSRPTSVAAASRIGLAALPRARPAALQQHAPGCQTVMRGSKPLSVSHVSAVTSRHVTRSRITMCKSEEVQ